MSIQYRHNIMKIGSLSTFARVRGGYSQGKRDVYFLRAIGGNDTLKREILEIDELLDTAMSHNQLLYKRLSGLPFDLEESNRAYYLDAYEKWMETGGTSAQIRYESGNADFNRALGSALKTVELAYDRFRAENTASMKRNFMIKLMRWTDFVMEGSPLKWNERSCMKIVADNVGKVQEYLFYYMLTLLGADVMLLQTKKNIDLPDWMGAYAKEIVLGEFVTWELPKYVHGANTQKSSGTETAGVHQLTGSSTQNQPNTVQVCIPERVRKVQPAKPVQSVQVAQRRESREAPIERREKSFEELALLASSIVMITIHDQSGEAIGSGSGIMVGEDGYILTNYHVVRGGRFYSVSIEDDDTVYKTDELIKYHALEDMAIIRIPRKLRPLPIYRGTEKLVRGQRVVAIGSPLGLFNSVSDGIISGFRTIDSVEMMQFTAPTSPGSSGGAILNMFGEVIGISTAGIDRGQNINLAVLYEPISQFIRGFC